MIRSIALLLTVLTGFSGLVYQVAWQKSLAVLLGSDAEAVATVLAVFLGGLSAGYAFFGAVTARLVERARRAGSRPRLLLLYGLVEAGIGFYALGFPWFFEGALALSVLLPAGAGTLGFAADVAITVLLIGPPTALMGGTIPILSQSLAESLEDATRVHAMIYAFNTAGAFAGALAAGFWLVPWLGLEGAIRSMGCVNLAAGGGFLILRLRGEPGGRAPIPSRARTRVEGFAALAAVALLLGFAMMAIQTTLNRVGALAFGASHFTFSMVVAVFVLCIALGSFAVSALPRIRPGYVIIAQWSLIFTLILLYYPMDEAPYLVHLLRSVFRDVDRAFYPYFLASFAMLLAVLAVPVALSGAMLPLLFHHLRREVSDLGHTAGRLYSWNTVGSLLGALLGGHYLLRWLDLHEVYRLSVIALAVGASLLTVRILQVSRVAVAAVGLAPVVAAVAWMPSWDPAMLSLGSFRLRAPVNISERQRVQQKAQVRGGRDGLSLLYYDDDPITTVTVIENQLPDGGVRRSVLTNGKSDGAIPDDYPTMVFVGTLPALLVPEPRSAFVIGYGTGVTAGELASLETITEVVVAEISAGVMEAAPLFDYGNRGASSDPKIRIVQGDAYRVLLRDERRYDIISSEPSNPWVSGVEMLYSREFLAAARDRLTSGGIYAQWFHTYETDAETIALVLRTYADVFERVAVWYALGPDLILLGFNADEPIALERLVARCQQPDYQASLERAGVTGVPALLAHELLPLGVVHAAGLQGEMHTLFHPILSDLAARAFFRGAAGSMPFTGRPEAARVGVRNSLLHRYAERYAGHLPDEDRLEFVLELCENRIRECAAALAHWLHDAPASPALARAIDLARQTRAKSEDLGEERLQFLSALFGGVSSESSGGGPAGPRLEDIRAVRDLLLSRSPFLAPRLGGRVEPVRSGERVSSALPARAPAGRAPGRRIAVNAAEPRFRSCPAPSHRPAPPSLGWGSEG